MSIFASPLSDNIDRVCAQLLSPQSKFYTGAPIEIEYENCDHIFVSVSEDDEELSTIFSSADTSFSEDGEFCFCRRRDYLDLRDGCCPPPCTKSLDCSAL